jgi:parvulin-like peptidyl-prolyl isomerase
MRALVLLIALLLSFAAPARAADDVATAQGIIRSQVEAIDRDDAATAYSYAAPTIQNMFPGADIFLGMVQRTYMPIYRHKSFEFGEGRAADGKIAQQVHIVDADGVPWEGLYTLEQQPDGSIKISGCVLLKTGEPA